MEVKLEGLKGDEISDELIRQMLSDILTGLKAKLVQPVLEENCKIAGQLEELKEQERTAIIDLKAALAMLDDKIQKVPLVILAALRDAINQAGGGMRNDD
ncbi:MAG: hypothetical protein A4E55_01908 [Pelotomaculum sp. PtaU1.Bin035]|nr:MAG: hypothetical protein A4E55_01908 [Pelotomaculum sp. PtaU1.Bin035]